MKRTFVGALLVLGLALAATASATDDISITGTLIARSADSVVVRTVDGDRTFAVSDVTRMSSELPLDSQVTVTYHDSGDTLMASQVLEAIVPAPAATAPTADHSMASGAAAPAPGATVPASDLPATTPVAQADTMTVRAPAAESVPAPPAEALPSTASQMPLLALIGVVMLAASLTLRWAR